MSLGIQLFDSNEELYLPLEALAQITGRNINYCGEGVYLLSKSSIALNEEEIQALSAALN